MPVPLILVGSSFSTALGNTAMGTASDTPRGREVMRGLKNSVAMQIGFIPFALVLGAQAVQKGLHPAEVSLMTGLNFAGGSEFAAIALWTSPPHLLLIAAITLLINSRHVLMGAALAPFIRHLSKRKALAVLFFMCDESWAMALADARKRTAAQGRQALSVPYYAGVSAGLYLSWVIFTTIGGLLGPIMGDVHALGFDMAFPAVFLVLIRGMWKGMRAAIPWGISLGVAILTYLFIPGSWYVASGACAGLLTAWLMAKESAPC